METTVQDIMTIDDTLNMRLLPLPLRSTIVRTPLGLVVLSPTGNLATEQPRIEAMGEVVAIVAPNLFHNLFVEKAVELFPKAKVWGPEGLSKKCPNINLDFVLGRDPWPFADCLLPFAVRGMPSFNEFVFHHLPSKSLIVFDLCFNLSEPKQTTGKILLTLFGTRNRFAVSRIFRMFIKNKQAFAESVREILGLDFTRIIMAHGTIKSDSAKVDLEAALVARNVLN